MVHAQTFYAHHCRCFVTKPTPSKTSGEVSQSLSRTLFVPLFHCKLSFCQNFFRVSHRLCELQEPSISHRSRSPTNKLPNTTRRRQESCLVVVIVVDISVSAPRDLLMPRWHDWDRTRAESFILSFGFNCWSM